ncbi:MAG: aminotransferase class V-fold PLP-dependent enzyme [Microbacteriaceae bacterium]
MALDLHALRDQFPHGAGYLSAATMGLPPKDAVIAMRHDLDLWSTARKDPADYCASVERTRAHYAALVGVSPHAVALASQTSVMASLIAHAVPEGREVLVVDGDFTSTIFPFYARNGISVRSVPLAALAAEISSKTWLVSFSLIQSANGQVADVAAITEAAAEHGTLTFCDVTQAAGIHPVDASQYDITACHAYKWLCSPRGVGFLTVNPRVIDEVPAIQAGWYAGSSVWESIYGPGIDLATDARRFDISPSWQAWVGAEPAIELFSSLDSAAVWSHASALGAQFLEASGRPILAQAIVTVPDRDGRKLLALQREGITASGRDGCLRLAFHVWNDTDDVERALDALTRSAS